MPNYLVQLDSQNLVSKIGITAEQAATLALDFTVYPVNADNSRGAGVGPTRNKHLDARPAAIVWSDKEDSTPEVREVAMYARDNSGNISGLVDGDGNSFDVGAKQVPFLRSPSPDFESKAVYYKMDETSGAVIRDSLGNGPDITVRGNTADIWRNPGWLSYHSAGNAMQAVNDPYIDELTNMKGFSGSLLFSIDYWEASHSTSTETYHARTDRRHPYCALWRYWCDGRLLHRARAKL